jgi:hypothetical protein
MLTIKLLANWFLLSSLLYGLAGLIILPRSPSGDFSRAGANFVFLSSQALAASILAIFV